MGPWVLGRGQELHLSALPLGKEAAAWPILGETADVLNLVAQLDEAEQVET